MLPLLTAPLLLVSSLLAQTLEPPPVLPPKKPNVEERIADLEKQIAFLESAGSLISSRVNLIESNLKSGGFRPRIDLDPADSGWSTVSTNLGNIAIALKSAKPHLDGVLVTLAICVPMNVDISATLFATWNERKPPKSEVRGLMTIFDNGIREMDWKTQHKHKTFETGATLRSGNWNEIQIFLPGTPPEKFGYLELGMSVGKIQAPTL